MSTVHTPEGGLLIKSHTGLPINVRLIHKGDRYGLDWCLTYEDERGEGPKVEFLAAAHAKPDGSPSEQWGYHISRYYVKTLMDSKNPERGLCLDGGMREFDIKSDVMASVREWMTESIKSLKSPNAEAKEDNSVRPPRKGHRP